jgi:cleavage and polyadenylation specificity factor subunit 2
MDVDDNEPVAEEERPSKCISVEKTISVKCSVRYFDFEGRSDGRSIKAIIEHVMPRKLILVHGNQESNDHLTTHVEKTLKSCKGIFAPANNEKIDVSSDSNIYKVYIF